MVINKTGWYDRVKYGRYEQNMFHPNTYMQVLLNGSETDRHAFTASQNKYWNWLLSSVDNMGPYEILYFRPVFTTRQEARNSLIEGWHVVKLPESEQHTRVVNKKKIVYKWALHFKPKTVKIQEI